MDYHKFDAPLASALEESTAPDRRELLVFLHAREVPNANQCDMLQRLGVALSPGRKIFTARLSAAEIRRLSNEPWIMMIRLSQRLRALGDEPPGS